MYSVKNVIKTLNKNNFNFKKKYGQNFIIDENIINSIINKSLIDKKTLVIEVGPGMGVLTYKLAKKSKYVISYEIDKTLKPILETNLKKDNIKIIYDDFLQRNIKNDLINYKYEKLFVISNLPYNITTPIIFKIIEENLNVDKMVFMVQKELGNRFKAKPQTKDYNALSILLNYYFEVKKIMDVSRNVFIPKPNVDSVVIEFTKRKNKLKLKNKKDFIKLVKDSFKNRRKMLKNNLKNYDIIKISEILSKYNYSLKDRAEVIPMEVYVKISNGISD